MFPALETFPVTVPAPLRVPPLIASIPALEIEAPEATVVVPADCAKLPLNASVPMFTASVPELLKDTGGPTVKVPVLVERVNVPALLKVPVPTPDPRPVTLVVALTVPPAWLL